MMSKLQGKNEGERETGTPIKVVINTAEPHKASFLTGEAKWQMLWVTTQFPRYGRDRANAGERNTPRLKLSKESEGQALPDLPKAVQARDGGRQKRASEMLWKK